GAEEAGNGADAFGSPEDEESARARSVVKQRDDLVLKHGLQIDKKVAAADDIHLGEGWIVEDIVLGEDAHVANALADAIAAFGFGEEAAEALGRNVALNIFGVDASAGLVDAGLADVGAKELDRNLVSFVAEKFKKRDRDRIGFFSGGTTGSPDANDAFRSTTLEDGREDLRFQGVENLGVAEEAGDIDEHVLIEG